MDTIRADSRPIWPDNARIGQIAGDKRGTTRASNDFTTCPPMIQLWLTNDTQLILLVSVLELLSDFFS